MKPIKPDSSPETKTQTAKIAAAEPPSATKSRQKAPSSVQLKKPAPPARPKIPPFLLERDEAAPWPASGPGRRYVLGPAPPVHPAPAGADLPESYGTQQLFLAARDPRWLYAHWDFTPAQLTKYNALSADGHLLLQLYRDAPGRPAALADSSPSGITALVCAGAPRRREIRRHPGLLRRGEKMGRTGPFRRHLHAAGFGGGRHRRSLCHHSARRALRAVALLGPGGGARKCAAGRGRAAVAGRRLLRPARDGADCRPVDAGPGKGPCGNCHA